MDPAAANGNGGIASPITPLAPVAPAVATAFARDRSNSQALGRSLNAHVKQVGRRTGLLASLLPLGPRRATLPTQLRSKHVSFLHSSSFSSVPALLLPFFHALHLVDFSRPPSARSDMALTAQSCVLMVGAGGIGCELLKNLVLAGFGEVHIVDLDTIDLSNLNRQFLFRQEHIKKPKALVWTPPNCLDGQIPTNILSTRSQRRSLRNSTRQSRSSPTMPTLKTPSSASNGSAGSPWCSMPWTTWKRGGMSTRCAWRPTCR